MNARTRLWVLAVIVICAGVVFLGVAGGLMPQLADASSSYRILQDTRERNEGMREQIQQLENAEADLPALEKQYEELIAAIPADAGTSGLLSELQNLQQQSGARVVEFALQNAGPVAAGEQPASQPNADNGQTDANGNGETLPTKIDRISLDLQLTGSPEQIAAFVALLQSGERLMLAESFELFVSPDQSNATLSGAVFTLGTIAPSQ